MAYNTYRSKGQKLVPIPINEEFLGKLDRGLETFGYANRAQFARDAIREKLIKAGFDIPIGYAQPPSRRGKGGRQRGSDGSGAAGLKVEG